MFGTFDFYQTFNYSIIRTSSMHRSGPPGISRLSYLTQTDTSAEILADEFGRALHGAKSQISIFGDMCSPSILFSVSVSLRLLKSWMCELHCFSQRCKTYRTRHGVAHLLVHFLKHSIYHPLLSMF